MTMAYVEGYPLSQLVEPDRPLSQGLAARIVGKLARAMQEAHARGVIHRDLKPSNVMIDDGGEPVVMDFGLARFSGLADARVTRPGTLLGTPAYMAPEQIHTEPNEVGPACDIYALGVILYELLTGRLPFQGSVLSILSRIPTEPPPPPSDYRSDLDPQLEALCLKAMARNAADRYTSMVELAEARRPVHADATGELHDAGADDRCRIGRRRARVDRPAVRQPTGFASATPRAVVAPAAVQTGGQEGIEAEETDGLPTRWTPT